VNGTELSLTSGCVAALVNGGLVNEGGTLANAGDLTIEGNLINSGEVNGGGAAGMYRLMENLEHNGTMTPHQSTFELYGGDQAIMGVTPADFFNLTLIGTGRKVMLNDANVNGTLAINDRILDTRSYTLYHRNPDPASITYDDGVGFSRSDAGGGLSRETNASAEYIFPVGDDVEQFRYRPVMVRPSQSSPNTYKVRMANQEPPFRNLLAPDIYFITLYFYHKVERLNGASPAELAFSYLPSEDGTYQGMAYLSTTSNEWEKDADATDGPTLSSNPDQVSFTTANWSDFSSTDHALASYTSDVWVPNIFSPNEDGENDVFKAYATNIRDFKMKIWDRWGKLMFEGDNIEIGWDGTHNGTRLNTGVFVYTIEGNGTLLLKGDVTLVR